MSFTTDSKNRAGPEVADERTLLVRRNRKISASNLGSETGYTEVLRGFPQSPQKKFTGCHKLFLPYTFEFAIH